MVVYRCEAKETQNGDTKMKNKMMCDVSKAIAGLTIGIRECIIGRGIILESRGVLNGKHWQTGEPVRNMTIWTKVSRRKDIGMKIFIHLAMIQKYENS